MSAPSGDGVSPVDRRPVVAVIGASSASPEVLEVATEAGRRIGEHHWHLLCGGGEGVMEAACRGFQSVQNRDGASAIGILPGEDVSWGNRFLDVVIPSGIGWARNAVIVRSADGVIAVGGGSGTLSEIAFAWQMGKPIAAVVSTGGWSAELGGRSLDARRVDPVFAAADAEQAVQFIHDRIIAL